MSMTALCCTSWHDAATQQAVYCLSNAMHCMGQNKKSLAACFCVCAQVLGPNISKTVRDIGSVRMGHQ